MQLSLKSLIFSFIVNSARAGRDVIPFTQLQVSSPLTVEVVTDTSQSQVSLDIAADGMGLGWSVKASVEPMTFGRTLLLGMDERAARQGLHWPSTAGQATLRVPEALTEVSATGGAQVLVDVVTSALLADSKSNLTVTKFVTANENRTNFIMASSGANITVEGGFAGKAFVRVGTGCIVKLGCLVSEAAVEADKGAKLFINAERDTLNINAEDEETVKIIEVNNSLENAAVKELGEFPVIPWTVMRTWGRSDGAWGLYRLELGVLGVGRGPGMAWDGLGVQNPAGWLMICWGIISYPLYIFISFICLDQAIDAMPYFSQSLFPQATLPVNLFMSQVRIRSRRLEVLGRSHQPSALVLWPLVHRASSHSFTFPVNACCGFPCTAVILHKARRSSRC